MCNSNLKETKGVIAIKGASLTLLGDVVKVGDVAKEFTSTDKSGSDVKLSDFSGKIVVISSFPSIDTPVCAAQTREFNKRASEISSDVVILSISKDLPFALGRFCAAEGIDRIYMSSDYKHSDFGKRYGFLIKENLLLARGVVVIDRNGVVKYVEYVPEVTSEPDYASALKVISLLAAS